MNNYMVKIKEMLNKYKKRLIIGTTVGIVTVGGLGVAGASYMYNKAKLNINYTTEQAKQIALTAVEGEVISAKKELELEDLRYEYDIQIKDTKNILVEVTVDAKTGAIIELDSILN